MLIYEKTVDGKRHLYYSESGIPGPEDIALTYKDGEGNIITPVDGDTYRDHSSEGVHRIKRDSDGKVVNVFAGEKQIIGDEIPQPVPPVVEEKEPEDEEPKEEEPKVEEPVVEEPVEEEPVEEPVEA